MSILIFDDSKFELIVRCKPSESFSPDEEVKQLVAEFDSIRKDQLAVNQRLSLFLPKCTAWSRKHDSILDAKISKREEDQKKDLADASASGEAQV